MSTEDEGPLSSDLPESEDRTITVISPAAAAPAPVELPEPVHATAEKPLCTVGRRKAAQARARIHPGEGVFIVNARAIEEYFALEVDRNAARRPLELVGASKKYDVRVKVQGGGSTGQADAISLALARAISLLEPVNMRQLRVAGLLTRDARVKERKKYGRRGARRGFQFSKR